MGRAKPLASHLTKAAGVALPRPTAPAAAPAVDPFRHTVDSSHIRRSHGADWYVRGSGHGDTTENHLVTLWLGCSLFCRLNRSNPWRRFTDILRCEANADEEVERERMLGVGGPFGR